MKNYTSLKDLQVDLNNKRISCVRLVDHYLSNIEEYKDLNAFSEVYSEEARQRAHEIDKKISAGKQGRLAGLVIGLKDVISYKEHTLQAASKVLENYTAGINATAVDRLLEEDAIIIGRQNCDEFGMGSSNENSVYGPVRNGIDPQKVPGGSSGGSAVAVQMDMCQAAIGSDTGGSVRQPAALCGIIGLKPTYSRISRYGLVAYASSFDCIAILSKSIADNAAILSVISGEDRQDSTVSTKTVPKQDLPKPKKKYNVAYIKETLENEGLSKAVKNCITNKIDLLLKNGHSVEPVELGLLDYLLPTYYILSTAEASANLSRYDGVRYGHRSTDSEILEDMYKNTRTQGFGKEVIRRILLGTFVLSASYYDAYYTKAQKVRRLIRDKTKEILKKYDFIIVPTTPTTAFNLGGHRDNPVEMYLEDLYTVQASVSGTPAISIPVGVDQDNLPVGLQVLSDEFKEPELYAFADYVLSLK